MDKVDVDFEAKTATITMKEGKTLSKDDLNKAFKDSRFECTKVESIEAEKKEDTEDTKEG